MNYLDKVYQVTMSVQQMAVVLTFNDQDECSIADLNVSTRLTTDALGKILRSLFDSGILKSSDKVRV